MHVFRRRAGDDSIHDDMPLAVRGVRRRAPGVRAASLLLLVVVVLAQPQVLCGLHCAFFAGSMPMDAPAPHHAGHAHGGALCHGHTMTGRRTVPVGRLATAWLPSAGPGTTPAPEHALGLPTQPPPQGSPLPDPEGPPPRG